MTTLTRTHVHHGVPDARSAEDAWESEGGAIRTEHPTHQNWDRVGAALTDHITALSNRQDLIVTVETTTRSGAPGAFFPAYASVELDAATFDGLHPSTVNPDTPGDNERYPKAWGVLAHEASHADHSVWKFPDGAPNTAATEASTMLEEPRIEGIQTRLRPSSRRWMRASATGIILPNMDLTGPATVWMAASAAGLILARVDAGVLTKAEAAPVARAAAAILGNDLLDKLRTIWQAALRARDHDAAEMIRLGRMWCDALGQDPDQAPPAPGGDTGVTSELAKAVARVVRSAAANPSRGEPEDPDPFDQAMGKANPGNSTRNRTVATRRRPPTDQEKAAAADLARRLRTAALRAPSATRLTSVVPPGRLNTRAALTRQAQKAAGTVPTAEPFARTRRKANPNPPLSVGIVADVSGSMNAAISNTGSAAWVLAKAVTAADPRNRCATIAFGETVAAIIRPGQAPGEVTEFTANHGGHRFTQALDVLEVVLAGAEAKLVVFVTDFNFGDPMRKAGERRLAAMQAAGTALLWMDTPGSGSTALGGLQVTPLTGAGQAANVIGRAAVRALERAVRG
jgi:hypothetical protein